MSYSRRQLEAFGEPLGESVTRKESGRIVYGSGGGGGGSGTQTTVTEVPDWAKGTAQKSLAGAEALTFQKDAQGNVTGFQPYQQYGGERTAQFTPLQQQSFQGAGAMQTAPQLGMASNLAGSAAFGALGAGGRFDPYQTGQFGPQASQYMDPYMQNVVGIQQREAQRQADIAGTQRGAQAVQSGAFGGSRQAIMDAEAARNLATQKGDIQARGLQDAYGRGQQQFNTEQQLREQSRQYGAGLGLQGFQTALQGAGQLGALGQQEFGQQKDILGMQNQFGSQQQQQVQNILSQQYQDFLNQKKHPYQQLEFLSNMIRGTPMGTVQTMYGAQPTMAQNIGAIGMGAYGLNQMMGRAEGGTVSSYADGGSVDSPQNIESIVDRLSDPQLKQAAEAAQARGDVEQLQIIQQEMAMRASERGGMAGAFNQLPQEQQQQMMAGGGVVAFAGDDDENEGGGLGQLVGGMMPSEGNPEVYKQMTGAFPQLLSLVAGAKPTRMSEAEYEAARNKALEQYKTIAGPSPYEGLSRQIGEMREEGATGLKQAKGLAALKAASAMMQGRGFVRGLAQAGGAFGESYGQALQADKAQKRSLMNMEIQMADARRKENLGLYKEAEAAAERARKSKEAAGEFGLRKANALANVAGKFATATKPTKAAGSGAGKGPKINEQLAAAEIAHETNPTSATLATVNALRRAVAQTKTSDFGPTRAGLGEAGLEVRLGEAITEAQQKIKFTPDYLKADAAGKQQMLRDAAAGVRANAGKNAGVNTNSTSGSGSGTVEGLPAGATVKGDKVYDSSGKLIGHVK